MTTVNTLITDALIDCNEIDPSDTITATELAHGLRVINRMLGIWSVENLIIPYTTSENFSLTSGTASYTMGSAGTASSTRAKRIASAYIRDSNSYDYPVTVIDQRRYNKFSNKSLGGRPEFLFYDPTYPVGTIYFYKVPSSSYTAYIESIKDLHSALADGGTLSLPGEYEAAIVSNLRNRLAKSYGRPVSQEWMLEADNDLRVIKNLNLANRLETMDMPAGVGGNSGIYNINDG